MKLLACFHDGIFLLAILGATFVGMALEYKAQAAERRGEEKALISVYTNTSLKGLSEIGI